MHKQTPVVKTTGGEKVTILSQSVASFYVNQPCISTTPAACGKLLWKNLLRMWKTMSFQQVFPFLVPGTPPVENCEYSAAYPGPRRLGFCVMWPAAGKNFLAEIREKVGFPEKTAVKIR